MSSTSRQVRHGQGPTGRGDRGGARFRRDRRQDPNQGETAEPRRLPPSWRSRNQPGEAIPTLLRHQHLGDAATDHLGWLPPKRSHCCRVEFDDLSLMVDSDDAVESRLGDCRPACFAASDICQGSVSPLELTDLEAHVLEQLEIGPRRVYWCGPVEAEHGDRVSAESNGKGACRCQPIRPCPAGTPTPHRFLRLR